MNPLIRDTVKVCIAYLVLIQTPNSFYLIGHTKKAMDHLEKAKPLLFAQAALAYLNLTVKRRIDKSVVCCREWS